MKVLTQGRWLWSRTIGSTIVGERVDTLLFTPVTYAAVTFLKRAEHEDYYDRKTNFNPFAILPGKLEEQG